MLTASRRARTSTVKNAHNTARQAIRDDVNASDVGKRERLDALNQLTRSKLDAIKGEQESHVSGVRDRLERELRGSQPSDANSVLLRRHAADRARDRGVPEGSSGRTTRSAERRPRMSDFPHSFRNSAHAAGVRALSSHENILD